MKKTKKAFTLAELLISMAIVGVISVLMIPVMQNAQDKILETETAHFHSMMSEAIKQYMTDNDIEDLKASDMVENRNSRTTDRGSERYYAVQGVDNFINKYLKVKKACSYYGSDRYDCFPETMKSIKNSYNIDYQRRERDSKAYVLSNGAVLAMRPFAVWANGGARGAEVQFDVNGKKGPNTAGRDIWYFVILFDGTITDRVLSHWESRSYKSSGSNGLYWPDYMINNLANNRKYKCTGENGFSDYAGGCFARFEANGFKFDY